MCSGRVQSADGGDAGIWGGAHACITCMHACVARCRLWLQHDDNHVCSSTNYWWRGNRLRTQRKPSKSRAWRVGGSRDACMPLPVGETTKRRVERVCIHWFLATLSHVSHFWCPCRSQSRPASTRDRIFTTTAAHTRGHAGSVTSRGEVPYGGAEDSQQHERRIHNRALRWGAWGESDRRQGRRAYSAHSGRCRRTVAICAPCAIRADHVGAVRLRGVSDACDLVVRVKASPGHVLGGQANRERMVTRPRKDVHTFKVYPAEPWLHLRKPV